MKIDKAMIVRFAQPEPHEVGRMFVVRHYDPPMEWAPGKTRRASVDIELIAPGSSFRPINTVAAEDVVEAGFEEYYEANRTVREACATGETHGCLFKQTPFKRWCATCQERGLMAVRFVELKQREEAR